MKTSDNLLEGNQLTSSEGGFTQRYGRNNTFARNVITNSRGIAIGGRGAKVIGNQINGTAKSRSRPAPPTPTCSRMGRKFIHSRTTQSSKGTPGRW